MSFEKITHSVDSLYRAAMGTNDIKKLKVIRERLLQLSAWKESELVRLKIHGIENPDELWRVNG